MSEHQLTIKELADMIQQHSIDDDLRFSQLATKEDIKEMMDAFDDYMTALRLFRTTSKWGYRVLLVTASIVIAVVSIGGGYKTILSWFTK